MTGWTLALADKLTFGATPTLVREIERDPARWLEGQLAPTGIDDPQLVALAASLPTLTLPASERLRLLKNEGNRTRIRWELISSQFGHAVLSRHQLRERMVDFWLDHFNVAWGKGQIPFVRPDDVADIRSLALGNFADLLVTVAKSPSMLWYLDLRDSAMPKPNENYARELLELHTVGVDGGYDEGDVHQAALTLSGWTTSAPQHLAFTFDPAVHHTGPVEVMDWSHAGATGPGAVAQGEQLLRHLAVHPSTGRFLATKLAAHFVTDDPPAELVSHLADAFARSGGDIASVMRALATHPSFVEHAGSKLRRGFHAFAGAARGMQAQLTMHGASFNTWAEQLEKHLEQLDHVPFSWPTPDGFPQEDEHWSTSASFLARWNILMALAANSVRSCRVTPARIVGDAVPVTVRDLAERIAAQVRARPPSDQLVDELVAYTGFPPGQLAVRVGSAVQLQLAALVLARPDAQLH